MAENDDLSAPGTGEMPSRPPADDATRIQPQRATPAARPATIDTATAAANSTPTSILHPGQLLAHTYEIEALIARGGMGEVYRARHIDVGSRHAIKVILPELANNPAILNMFTEEARKLRMVRDDAVVAYDGMFRDESGLRYLVMEFVDGFPLAKAMRDKPFTPAEVRQLRDRLAQGLGAAHARQIYHRDISPDNVLLVDGRVDHAKIVDFGIAKDGAPGEHTIIGSVFAGKYSWVAPEQLGMFGGTVDGRSDIYSLGLVLVAAALGHGLPMGNSPASAVEARGRVPDLSALPPDLAEELAPLLEPDPARRPQSLGNLPRGSTKPPRPAPPSPPPKAGAAPARRAPVAIAAALLGLAILGGGGAWLYLGRENAPPAPEPQTAVAAPAPPVPAPAPVPVPAPPQQEATLTPAPVAPPATIDAGATRLAIGRAVDSVTQSGRCAEIKTALADDGTLDLSGFVSSDDDDAALRSSLAAVPGVSAVKDAVAVFQPQHCQVIRLLASSGALAAGAKPRLDFNIPSLLYRAGDKLVVRTTPPSDAYLAVDFYDSAGQVVHLRPSPQSRGELVKAGQVVTLGTDKDKPSANQAVYEISEPFGPNLVVAIASRTPLLEPRRNAVEDAKPYLAALAATLQRRDAAALAANFTIIETIPR